MHTQVVHHSDWKSPERLPESHDKLRKGQDILLQGKEANILIKDGRIAYNQPNISDLQLSPDTIIIDARSCIISPGFTDLHVHFREPGFSYKESIATGSSAAARGGYTTVCTMPNLSPTPDSPEHLSIQQAIIDRDATIEVLPYASITQGRAGSTLVDFAALKPHCVAFSDDGSGVQDAHSMLLAMQAAKINNCIIAAHCEDNTLLRGGYIHLGQYCQTHNHKGICSESEWTQIARDLKLCEQTGCRYHVCHISCKESVELIRKAKSAGLRVSCETAPHYLVLCEDDLREEGRFKMNPPLRSAEDREALIAGLIDGTIDAIATDHAPHSEEEKSRGLEGSAMGVVGLESAFAVLNTALVRTGKVSLERVLEALSDGPRKAFGLEQNILRVGDSADITIIDCNESYTIDSSTFASKGHSTPFDGMQVWGRIKMTIYKGKIVWTDGSLA